MGPPIGCGGCGSAGCSRVMPGSLPGSLGRSSGVRWGVPGIGSRCGRSGVSGVVGSLGRSGCSLPGGVTSGCGSGPPGWGSGYWSMALGGVVIIGLARNAASVSGIRCPYPVVRPRPWHPCPADHAPAVPLPVPREWNPPEADCSWGAWVSLVAVCVASMVGSKMSAMPPGRRHRAMTLFIVG
jgi:hypothetical protein